jgi:hypothetical protein
MTVRRVKIQRAGDIVEIAERKELNPVLILMSFGGDEDRESKQRSRKLFRDYYDLTYLHLERFWSS